MKYVPEIKQTTLSVLIILTIYAVFSAFSSQIYQLIWENFGIAIGFGNQHAPQNPTSPFSIISYVASGLIIAKFIKPNTINLVALASFIVFLLQLYDLNVYVQIMMAEYPLLEAIKLLTALLLCIVGVTIATTLLAQKFIFKST